MKILYAVLPVLLVASSAFSQDITIPLFDDETPNLGRNAKPLDNLVLTPPPLPSVSVDIKASDSKKTAAGDNASATKTVIAPKPAVRPNIKIDPPRTEPIQITSKEDTAKTDELLAALEQELERTKGLSNIETPDLTAAESGQPAEEKVVINQPLKSLQLIDQVNPKMEEVVQEKSVVQTPQSLEGLFGKTHDVLQFSIAGLSLHMTPEEIIETAKGNGFQLTKVQKGLPLFKTSHYEHKCRQARVYRPDSLRDCILSQARLDEVEYVSSLTFLKPASKEHIQVLFSSQATDNVAFKIYYESEGDNSLTMTQKNLAKQLRRKEAFWKMMFETYGLPDDSDSLIWGDTQTTYMQATMQGSAYNAYIVLEDKEIQTDDYFAAEDEAKGLSYKMPFSFAEQPEEE